MKTVIREIAEYETVLGYKPPSDPPTIVSVRNGKKAHAGLWTRNSAGPVHRLWLEFRPKWTSLKFGKGRPRHSTRQLEKIMGAIHSTREDMPRSNRTIFRKVMSGYGKEGAGGASIVRRMRGSMDPIQPHKELPQ